MLGPDLSFSHILIVAAVALIVVGPKDLPVLLRKVGQFVARMRGMANEFRASFDEMARQSELDELRKEVAAMRSGQYGASSLMGSDASQVFSDIDSSLRGGDVSFSPALASYETPVEEAAPAAEPEPTPRRVRKPKAEAPTIAKPAARAATKPPRKAASKPKAAAAKPARKRAAKKPPEIVS